MSFCLRKELNDPVDDNQCLAKTYFAIARVAARNALTLQSRHFNQLESYAIYSFGENSIFRFQRTAPTNISDKLQQRQMYGDLCTFDQVESNYFPQQPKANSNFLITNYGSEKAKVVPFLLERFPSFAKMHKEIALMNIECRPMRSKPHTKSNSELRDVAPEVVANSCSSGDEKSDLNASPKSTKQKSKNQGKAKTFKRKTKRRGRV